MTVYISRDDSYAIKHYGVRGMKWGVRKDPYSTVQRVNKKVERYDRKSGELQAKRAAYIKKALSRNTGKYQLRADRLNRRAAKLDRKAGKQKARRILETNWNKVHRYEGKAEDLRYKANRNNEKASGIDAKSNRMLYKSKQYDYKRNKIVNNTSNKLSKLSSRDKKKGELYTKKVFEQNKKYREAKASGANEEKLNRIKLRGDKYNSMATDRFSKSKQYEAARKKLAS